MVTAADTMGTSQHTIRIMPKYMLWAVCSGSCLWVGNCIVGQQMGFSFQPFQLLNQVPGQDLNLEWWLQLALFAAGCFCSSNTA